MSKHHAIEPMYTAPQPQADALDAEPMWLQVDAEVQFARAVIAEATGGVQKENKS